MKKSIETIWEEGFLKNDALIAPKINSIYNQKSNHIVEKFRRMYKINIIAIVIFATLILPPLMYSTNLPYLGIAMFILFGIMVVIALGFYKRLSNLDKNQNSYNYIMSFDVWVRDMVTTNSKLSTYLYPYMFLAMISGFWFGAIGGHIPGNDMMNRLIIEYPDMHLIFGLPVIGVIGVGIVMSLLAYFGGKIGTWDINLVYGGILKKLDSLVSDMEELRK